MYMRITAVKKKKNIFLLFGENCDQANLDQLLTTQNFCSTIEGLYGVYFVLKEGGVGIDYPTTEAINALGGNAVIVCMVPTTYSQLH